jgi:hypothetical protein
MLLSIESLGVKGLLDRRRETDFSELPILEVSLHPGVHVCAFEDSTRKQVMSNASGYLRAKCVQHDAHVEGSDWRLPG